MNDGIDQVTKGALDSLVGVVKDFFYDRRRKRLLKRMLKDSRFPKGFRSTDKLRDAIQCDVEKTANLLIAIGARKSETSDEWTLNPPPKR